MTLATGEVEGTSGREPAFRTGDLTGVEPRLPHDFALASMRPLLNGGNPTEVHRGFGQLTAYLQSCYQIAGERDLVPNILKHRQAAGILLDALIEAGNLQLVAPGLVRPIGAYINSHFYEAQDPEGSRDPLDPGHNACKAVLVGYRLSKSTEVGDAFWGNGSMTFRYVANRGHWLRGKAAHVCIDTQETDPRLLMAFARNVYFWLNPGVGPLEEDEGVVREMLAYLKRQQEITVPLLLATAQDGSGDEIRKEMAIELLNPIVGVDSTPYLVGLIDYFRANPQIREASRLIHTCVCLLQKVGDNRAAETLRTIIGEEDYYGRAAEALIAIDLREQKEPEEVIEDAKLALTRVMDRWSVSKIVSALGEQQDMRYEAFFRSLLGDEKTLPDAILAISRLPLEQGELEQFLRVAVFDRSYSDRALLSAVSAIARSDLSNKLDLLSEVMCSYGLKSEIGWRALEYECQLRGLPAPEPVGGVN